MLIRKYKEDLVFNISDRMLWIFYLILFNKIEPNFENRSLLSKEVFSVKSYIKKYTNLDKYKKFFNLLNLDIISYSSNYTFSNLLSTLLYYLYILPRQLNSKKIYNSYYSNFKMFLNILNLYFIPNYIHKPIDIFFFKKKKIKLIKNYYCKNVTYIYYNKYSFDLNYYSFLKILNFLNNNYVYNYNYLLNYYSFIVNNLFYKNFKTYFYIKDINLFSSTWYETKKRIILNICSLIEKNDDFYIQNRLMVSYSSIKFTKALGFSKNYTTSFVIKIIMIQHLRRVLISSNIFKFFIFLKNYIKDFKLLFLNIKSPLNEIFLNSLNKNKNSLICDIYINYNSNVDVLGYMDKYKTHIESLFINNNLFNWNDFLNNFLNSLSLVSDFYVTSANSTFKKILLRYYLDCNVIFIFNKKLFPLKKKKAQSISRRRYKKIVKFAKRRFWIF